MVGILMTENENGMPDIVVENGEMVLGDVLQQNQALILTLHRGELKESPAVGVGISDMLLDHDPLLWRSRIREQLEMDGQTVNDIKITTNGVMIDASYK